MTDQQKEHTQLHSAFRAMDEPVNQKRVLVPAILFEVDPYSAGISGIRKSLELSLGRQGQMNDTEYYNLKEIMEVVNRVDPR